MAEVSSPKETVAEESGPFKTEWVKVELHVIEYPSLYKVFKSYSSIEA